jgi:hypothetical protein
MEQPQYLLILVVVNLVATLLGVLLLLLVRRQTGRSKPASYFNRSFGCCMSPGRLEEGDVHHAAHAADSDSDAEETRGCSAYPYNRRHSQRGPISKAADSAWHNPEHGCRTTPPSWVPPPWPTEPPTELSRGSAQSTDSQQAASRQSETQTQLVRAQRAFSAASGAPALRIPSQWMGLRDRESRTWSSPPV